jgi:rhodanese-related sulfurtransferase
MIVANGLVETYGLRVFEEGGEAFMLEFFLNHRYMTLAFVLSGIGYFIMEFKIRAGLKLLTTQEAVRLLNDRSVLVVDVRRTGELALSQHCSLPNAVHFPLTSLLKDIEAIKKEVKRKKVALVICQRGDRAYSAWSMLTAAGFQEIYTLNGGLNAWVEAGLPLKPLHNSQGQVIEGEVIASEIQG